MLLIAGHTQQAASALLNPHAIGEMIHGQHQDGARKKAAGVSILKIVAQGQISLEKTAHGRVGRHHIGVKNIVAGVFLGHQQALVKITHWVYHASGVIIVIIQVIHRMQTVINMQINHPV